MAKGGGTLPLRAVAKQKAFSTTVGGPQDHEDSVEKHLHERSAELQIPRLRCAPVGMTKGSVVLPLRAVAEGGGQGYATALQEEETKRVN